MQTTVTPLENHRKPPPLRPEASVPVRSENPPPARLSSLDAFRGLTVLGMLLVNNIALDTATPRHLKHADWSGRVHFADLVFPWFLLIVGVAIPYAAASHRKKGLALWRYDLKALGRALSLLLLGWLVDSTVAHTPVVGLGVLQVIGLAYFVAAVLSPLPWTMRLALAAAFLGGHAALIQFVPIPGVGAGQFTETRNIVDYINTVYLMPFGLRGLLSAVPTAALVLMGTLVGDTLRYSGRRRWLAGLWGKALFLVGAGLALVGAGVVWGRFLPMNKPVWTASYILYAGGWGTVALAALYLLIDGGKGGRLIAFPLIVPGMNAITAYVGSILIKVNILQGWTLPGDGAAAAAHRTLEQALQQWCYGEAGRIGGGWLYTGLYIGAWWLVLFYLYRRQIFLRV